MKKKIEVARRGSFSRRALILGGVQTAGFAAIFSRIYYLQVAHAEKFKTLSDENRVHVELEPPVRGVIFDRRGEQLAINDRSYSVSLSPAGTKNVEATVLLLNDILDLPDYDIERILKSLNRFSRRPVHIADRITWEQVNRIEVNSPDLPGVSIREGLLRRYPMGEYMSHVVGYVGRVSEKDQKKGNDPALYIPGFRIGKSGIERSKEKILRGKASIRRVEVNARGRTVRELKNYLGDPGNDVHLTIDTPLQFYVQDRLRQAGAASAVVMNVHNGEILALGSYPAYDANDFVLGFPQKKWDKLVNDERAPFRNKAIAGAYAPGSTFKFVLALAALADGLSPDWSVKCTGHIEVGPQRFHCWNRYGHGKVSMRNSIKYSCDVYYYELAQKIGIKKIAAMALKLGFGQQHLPELFGESSGLIPDKEWKQVNRDDAWRIGDTMQASIGQGYVLATPVQIAVMMSRIVNGGWAVSAHLLSQKGGQIRERLGIHENHLDIVKDAAFAVANEEKGTAYAARIMDKNLAMGGKTGTSQVRRITENERKKGVLKNEDLPWRLRDHALFAGYAPHRNPKYVCSVVVEHGGSGSSAAAPIARDILTATQLIDPIGNAPHRLPVPKPEEIANMVASKAEET